MALFEHYSSASEREYVIGDSSTGAISVAVVENAFVEPSSWVDEYRRIWNLFERQLRPGGG